ncbi:hypothetical protein GCM10010399_83890 [Dactylosporangium fulvum]|uniref:Response regulator n=1 Tax=Dactylosporangium fulvum TaxID=53359 RepID=A0ABY5VUL1_9ACTN|nr:response regulator [Dactylosporangium fulvum]UWP80536.1 response regulator [Dactylosporangium fulvum]
MAAVACLLNLVILDIMLPGQDGLTACERLQTDPETAHIPVMLLSALSQPDVVRSGVTAGAVHHMVKPFSLDALLGSVQLVLRVHPTPVDPTTVRFAGPARRPDVTAREAPLRTARTAPMGAHASCRG